MDSLESFLEDGRMQGKAVQIMSLQLNFTFPPHLSISAIKISPIGSTGQMVTGRLSRIEEDVRKLLEDTACVGMRTVLCTRRLRF